MEITEEEQEKYLSQLKTVHHLVGVPQQLKNDKHFILKVIERVPTTHYGIYFHLTEPLRSDEDIALAVIKKDGCSIVLAQNYIEVTEKLVLEAVKTSGYALTGLDKKFRDIKEIVLLAVKKEGAILKVVSERLRDDDEVVKAAIQNDPSALFYASNRLTGNKEFALNIVEKNGTAMQYLSSDLKNDKEIALVAFNNTWTALFHFGGELMKEIKENTNLVSSPWPSEHDQSFSCPSLIRYLEAHTLSNKLDKILDTKETQFKKIKI